MPWKEGKDEDERWNPFDDWFGTWPRRHRGLFASDIFDDLEKQFKRDWQYMNRIMRNAMSGKTKAFEEGGPYVYGWSLRVDSDGKPRFREFGNVSSDKGTRPQQVTGKREPLVDVVENDYAIAVTAELPGVAKEAIDLAVTEDTLTIDVDGEERGYHKEIQLPAEVKTDGAQATYQNGILDVELQKKEQETGSTKIQLD